MKKTLGSVALWTATGLAGLGALGFGINALTTLIDRPQNTGELYAMATAAAACLFAFSYLRDVIRDRAENARNTAVARPAAQAALHAPPSEWGEAPAYEPAPVRLERDCPYCAERILVAAKLCKHCRSDVTNV